MALSKTTVDQALAAVESGKPEDVFGALKAVLVELALAGAGASPSAAPEPAPATPPAGAVAVDASVVRRARKAGLSKTEAQSLAVAVAEQRAGGNDVDVAAAIKRYAELRSGRRDGGGRS